MSAKWLFAYYAIAEVGRGDWSYLVQPLFKHGHPEQGAQDHVQMAFGAL